ncbi:hypothetical protein J2Z69_000314 [Paenibacillus shirakamiensis]|uniref:Uncharacterized protein n=1 Tax=Paenibacillus shirakamiensis TaxID=1265935 RepID=A0ABS4JC45_9BACL|nr:hypothetical protein [Paenibacillus shirakamiensis]
MIYSTFLIALFSLVFCIIILHTIFEPGNLGKSLANYDIDYVQVNYEVNGNQTIEGIRVYENDKQVIIRDNCNILHSIHSDKISIKSIEDITACKKQIKRYETQRPNSQSGLFHLKDIILFHVGYPI